MEEIKNYFSFHTICNWFTAVVNNHEVHYHTHVSHHNVYDTDDTYSHLTFTDNMRVTKLVCYHTINSKQIGSKTYDVRDAHGKHVLKYKTNNGKIHGLKSIWGNNKQQEF